METVLLSTHTICFHWAIRKLIFCYTLLSGGLSGPFLDQNLFFMRKIAVIFLSIGLNHVFWVLMETVLLSTHTICFRWAIRKLIFCYTLSSGGLSGPFLDQNLFAKIYQWWKYPNTKDRGSIFLFHTKRLWHKIIAKISRVNSNMSPKKLHFIKKYNLKCNLLIC